ncbi:sensor histidine kinase [Massilia sp. TS11]|uniref:sensor histidine kinase n=1 Tax=Massilia sp. TS11 TaxID=2908003 RepID=UPI001EDA276C|nr:sensor histidine kinase [Massilia sp. TS11]MCG2586198.1 sensor histidine kinase [Massilia sp. TS11]
MALFSRFGAWLRRQLLAPAPRSRVGRRATDWPAAGLRPHPLTHRLRRSSSRLRELSNALISIREEERTRIARELHDDLGQLLAALRMDVALLREQPQRAAELAHGMDEHLLAAITSLRRIAAGLRPRALDEGGLFFALQGLRKEFETRHGIACRLYAEETDLPQDERRSTAIYRLVQEALTNIARHAGAQHVLVNVDRIDHQLLLTIQDDGRGITAADLEKPGSLGLVGMRERVWALNGDLHIAGGDARGTRIDITLPVSD